MNANGTGVDLRSDWTRMAGADLPLEVASVFPATEGFSEKRSAKRRAKLLAGVRPVLRRALEPEERILFAARAMQYSPGEFMASGMLVAQLSNQVALVATDRRLLVLFVDSKNRPKDLKNQIRYSEIRRVKSGGFLGSRYSVETLDRKTLIFIGIPRKDAKRLASAMPAPRLDAPKAPGRGLEHLCPACLRVVPGQVGSVVTCPNGACRIPFRSPRKAAWLSFLVPGLGDLYLRHHFFGTLEFVGSIVLLCMAVFLLLAEAPKSASDAGAAWTVAALLVLAPRIVDYALTLHMGRKGIVPLSWQPAPRGVAEGAPIEPRAAKPLPAFPVWARALFILGALAAAGTGWAAYRSAQTNRTLLAACERAQKGDGEAAWKLWEQYGKSGARSNDDRARFGLALYRGGDLEGGDSVLTGLSTADKGLVEEINAFIEKLKTASNDYQAGRQALLKGEDDAAEAALDRAIAFYRTLPRTPLPKSRRQALAELAGELLAPPPTEEDVAAAAHLLEKAEALPDGDARDRIAKNRLALLRGGQAVDAAAFASGDLASFYVTWHVLALEGRARLATTSAELAAIGQEAEKLTPAELGRLPESVRDVARARRLALMAAGGRPVEAPAELLRVAAELAESQGWNDAAAAIRGVPAKEPARASN